MYQNRSPLARLVPTFLFACLAVPSPAISQEAPPTGWSAQWRWETGAGEPELAVSVTNRSDRMLEVGPFRLSGAHAGEFALDAEAARRTTKLAPKASTTLGVRWKLDASRKQELDAALVFALGPGEKRTPGRVDLRKPLGRLPFEYKLEGFAARARGGVPRDAQGRIVVDDGYHDAGMVAGILRALAGDHPEIATFHALGKTWDGREIAALEVTSRAREKGDKPALLFIAAHHGNELLSTEFALDIAARLTAGYDSDPQIRGWVDRCRIWCVPLANPDGTDRFLHVNGAGRKNGRDTSENGEIDFSDGVDLNRNYPFRWHSLGEKGSSGDPRHGRYRGPEPASEPESRAVMALADRERFVMAISYHTAGTKILVPYTIDGARNPHPDVAWIVGASMAAFADPARIDRDYQPVRNLYPVDGTDQDWHYWRHGTLAYIWEGPRTNPLDPRERKAMIAGVRPGWRFMLERLAAGPTLSGRVRDAMTGVALEAVVAIEEIRTFEGEVHTSHPETGRFDRVLPRPGSYHLLVSKEGYRTRRVAVPLAREWKSLELELVRERGSQGGK